MVILFKWIPETFNSKTLNQGEERRFSECFRMILRSFDQGGDFVVTFLVNNIPGFTSKFYEGCLILVLVLVKLTTGSKPSLVFSQPSEKIHSPPYLELWCIKISIKLGSVRDKLFFVSKRKVIVQFYLWYLKSRNW